MSFNTTSHATPNVKNKPLIADVQAFELYASAALNRKNRGVLKKGVYNGFELIPSKAGGLAIDIVSTAESAACVEVGKEYLIKIQQQHSLTVKVPKGRVSVIVLKAFYQPNVATDQVDADSEVKAVEVLAVNVGSEPADSIILGEVNLSSSATSVTANDIVLTRRDFVDLETVFNQISPEDVQPKRGLWIRAALNAGIRAAFDRVREQATESIGTKLSWFKEVWANTYCGGSIDVEGDIKSGGVKALLYGEYGLGISSVLLDDRTDLNVLANYNCAYRVNNPIHAPEDKAGWWFVSHNVTGTGFAYQIAINFAELNPTEYYRTQKSGVWDAAWVPRYDHNNKPIPNDIGAVDLTQISNSTTNTSKNCVASSYALNQLKEALDRLASQTVTAWSYEAKTGETEVTMPQNTFTVNRVLLCGVEQIQGEAWAYDVENKKLLFAEPLMDGDIVMTFSGTNDTDLSQIIKEVTDRMAEIENILANGGGGSGGSGSSVLRVYNTKTNTAGNTITVANHISVIKLLFIDGVQQVESRSYRYNLATNTIEFTENFAENSFITLVYY